MQSGSAPQSMPMMTIQESVKTCLRKYADFNGRATRAEYWWWVLATVMVSFAIGAVDGFINAFAGPYAFSPFSAIFGLAVLLPDLAVTCRRLHDIGKTGWWQLLWFVIAGAGWLLFAVGLIITLVSLFSGGWDDDFFRHAEFTDFVPAILTFVIALVVSLAVLVWALIWLVRQGEYGSNKYGPDPRAMEAPPEEAIG